MINPRKNNLYSLAGNFQRMKACPLMSFAKGLAGAARTQAVDLCNAGSQKAVDISLVDTPLA
jgi:hypothetical protein